MFYILWYIYLLPIKSLSTKEHIRSSKIFSSPSPPNQSKMNLSVPPPLVQKMKGNCPEVQYPQSVSTVFIVGIFHFLINQPLITSPSSPRKHQLLGQSSSAPSSQCAGKATFHFLLMLPPIHHSTQQ